MTATSEINNRLSSMCTPSLTPIRIHCIVIQQLRSFTVMEQRAYRAVSFKTDHLEHFQNFTINNNIRC